MYKIKPNMFTDLDILKTFLEDHLNENMKLYNQSLKHEYSIEGADLGYSFDKVVWGRIQAYQEVLKDIAKIKKDYIYKDSEDLNTEKEECLHDDDHENGTCIDCAAEVN